MQTTTAFIPSNFQGENPMVLIRLFFVLSTAVLLFGCGLQPKTADELRDNVRGKAVFSSREVFEVKKPYRQVSDTLRKKWLECLDSTTTASFHRGGNTFGTQTNIYKPKVVVSDRRTELTLQHKATGKGITQVGGPPPEGFFTFVTDVYPVDKNTTRVDVQKQTPIHAAVMKAVRNWAEGTNMGCPDLAQ
jgi:hypothetical protein